MQIKLSSIVNETFNDKQVAYLSDDKTTIYLVNGEFLVDDVSKQIALDSESVGTIIIKMSDNAESFKLNVNGFKGELCVLEKMTFTDGVLTISKKELPKSTKTSSDTSRSLTKQTPHNVNMKKFAI